MINMEISKPFPKETAELFTLLPGGGDISDEADFCLVVTENCMSPYIKSGQRVGVSTRAQLEEFDVGVFYYEGRVYCRQWCEDYSGALHLLAAAPESAEDDLALTGEQRERCLCLGKVLLEKRPPKPGLY